MVPTLSIVFMAISALVSIGLPIALGIIWHKRTGAKASSLFIGAAAFVVFAIILENIFHRLVLYGSGSWRRLHAVQPVGVWAVRRSGGGSV